ncbi:MAG TPA: sigma-70 family RNA polymerase sigma factor [Candidatus Limnocylindrales bacterium]|jgi:RNA polymerase sigma-70 factor (ECF subfamily)|nr:sigma-70 family RNA polymerase sigma factor [Candidatus Limnocylindrales bacterium]
MTDSPEPVGAPEAFVTGETDEQLIERVGRGDGAALAALYDRYGRMAYALATRITGDPGLAEDAVQEAFLGLWRNAARYTPARGTVRTWALAIVHHRAVDSLRRRRPSAELPEGDVPVPSLVLPDVWPAVAGRLDRAAIGSALASLSGAQREAIELAYYGGFTQQEIASRTGTPLGTVKSRVRLGLLALREALVSGVPGTELLASAAPPPASSSTGLPEASPPAADGASRDAGADGRPAGPPASPPQPPGEEAAR